MSEKPASSPGFSQLLIDLGPIAVFLISYNVLKRIWPDDAVYWATGIFIATTLAAIAYCKITRGKIPPVLIVTGVLITVFGGLTIALHNEEFIKIKPTVMYVFFTLAIASSLIIKQNVWKLMFRHVFELPDRIWDVLAMRWAGLFIFMAILNEVIRQTQTTDGWVNARPIFWVLTLGFALINTPLVLKHSPPDEAQAKP